MALDAEGSPVDLVTVADNLRTRGQLARVGGTPYLAQLVDATPAVAHIETHAAIVLNAWRLRQARELGQRLASAGGDGFTDVDGWLAAARDELERLSHGLGPSPLEGIGAGEIFAQLEPVRYVVKAIDLCPGAPGLWAGYGYSGKTVAAQSAALSIAAGIGNVWGSFAAPQGKVLHLDYEQGSRLTRERYQRLAVPNMLGPTDVDGRLTLVTMPPLYLDQATAEAEIERVVDGYHLVLVDSLRASAPTLDENSSEARRVLDMLSRVSERTGAAVVVIHHARKPNAAQLGGAKMAIRGSGALFDACGSVLVFEGSEHGGPTRVSHEKARASGTLADDFELEISDVPDGPNPRAGLLVAAAAAPPRDHVADTLSRDRRLARTDQLKAEIRELFTREPEQGGVDSIAGKLGRKASDVRSALRLMQEAGDVVPHGSTRDRAYRLADSRPSDPVQPDSRPEPFDSRPAP